jgi:hypothetical protein
MADKTIKKAQKYPSITKYLQKEIPDLYEIIDDLSVSNSLNPRKGAVGITFLVPDEKYIKEIKKQAEGDDPATAVDMLFSLIIPDLIQTPEEWNKEIGNLLSKKIEVKEIKEDTVYIKDGSLVWDDNFVPFDRFGKARRGNMAVWKLTGKVNYIDAPDLSKPISFKKKKELTNSSEMELAQILRTKRDIEMHTIQIRSSPMINFVNSTIEYAKKDSTLYEKLKFVAHPSPIVVFYLIFGLTNHGLFTLQDLSEFISVYNAKYKAYDKSDTNDGFLQDAEGMTTKFGETRSETRKYLLQKLNPTKILADIKNVYKKADKENIMGLSKELSALLITNPDLHLIVDMMTFTCVSLCDSYTSIKKIIPEINNFIDSKGNVSLLRLENLLIKSDIRNTEHFLKSSCFLRIPGSETVEESDDSSDDETPIKPVKKSAWEDEPRRKPKPKPKDEDDDEPRRKPKPKDEDEDEKPKFKPKDDDDTPKNEKPKKKETKPNDDDTPKNEKPKKKETTPKDDDDDTPKNEKLKKKESKKEETKE